MSHWCDAIPHPSATLWNQVVILEAYTGLSRLEVLQQWLDEAKQVTETHTWLLNCDFESGGAWAGINSLFADLIPSLQKEAPHLLQKHSYELCLAIPSLRHSLPVKNPNLTEIAQGHERVRNYPADRANRSLHGLIDLLDTWSQLHDRHPLTIVCNNYDQATPFIQRFFLEVMRRRGHSLRLTLLLAVAPGHAEALSKAFHQGIVVSTFQLLDCEQTKLFRSHDEITRDAHLLEQQAETDPIVQEALLPALITAWKQSLTPEKAVYWQIQAMHRFNQLGLYEAAAVYCEDIEAKLESIAVLYPDLYPVAVISLFFCYLSLEKAEQAYHLMTTKIMGTITDPHYVPHNHYLIAMLYARYLPHRDFDKATHHLEQGLALLETSGLPDDVRYFYTIFLMNGLAFVRLRQRKPEEAVALCRQGLELFARHLKPDQHRLHRSILYYNIAQVYAVTGPYEEALDAFGKTMEMDPNYSEYYNERGNVFVQMEQWQEAEHDYLQAIELSPPYAEVWINLGQCYRAMERMEEAVYAYSRALDLLPDVTLPLIGRAEAYSSLRQHTQALADYEAALTLDPQQSLVLAARAIVYYENGDAASALDDLNKAIRLSPEIAVFYQNRATALIQLNYISEAIDDLQTYLRLDAEVVGEPAS